MEESGAMTPRLPSVRFLAALAALAFISAACGSTGTSSSRGSLAVASVKTAKSVLVAQLYGQALAHDGYTVSYQLQLGTRDVVAPAIESGQVDIYPGYTSTDLEYYNHSAGEASSDVASNEAKLNSRLQPLGLVALTPSPAVDQYAFAVTKATQAKYNLTKMSDLASIAGQLTLGTGPDCTTAVFCIPGLKKTYGITFKAFRPLDTDGPLTRAAFKAGTIDVGVVLSSDGDLSSLGLVVLPDDKHLENADNVVPIVRQAAANDEVTHVLNAIDAKLTTADLATMNSQVAIQLQDAAAVAAAWLQQHNYLS
jgi:osmoprotectant transport system substrate-binding protein